MVILCSTRIGTGKGGIATAAGSYLVAIRNQGLDVAAVTTHEPGLNRARNIGVFGGALLRIFWRLIRCRVARRRRAILYLHCGPAGSLARKAFLAVVGRACGAAVVTHHHSPKFADYLSGSGIGGILLRALARLSHCNLVLSEWWKGVYAAAGVGLTCVVPNCIEDPGGATTKPASHCSEEKIRLFTLARLVEGKNVDLVVDALMYLPRQYVLRIGGDGPLRKWIEDRIESHGLGGRVELLGWVEPAGKHALFGDTDLFVLPSEYDSFGMVFVEALAHGVPVLAANIPAVAAVLGDCDGVTLADSWDPQGLAKEIIHAASATHDPVGISQSALSRYGIDAVGIQLCEVLKSVANGKEGCGRD